MARSLTALALGLALAGCTTFSPATCRRPATDEPIPYTGGTVEDGVYMTSDWDGELLYFPGGAYYRIRHGLGARPRWWQCWVSFDRQGVANASVAQAAGNEVELKAIDEESLTVVNGTCVEFWLLCAVGDGASGGAGASGNGDGAGGAGGGAGAGGI